MPAFAIYRLPHADHAILIQQTEGEPEAFSACSQLNGRQGFVVAPFEATPEQPILLIRPDRVEQLQLTDDSIGHLARLVPAVPDSSPAAWSARAEAETYSVDFANFHAQLVSGTFRKIVLARCAQEQAVDALPPTKLFLRACERYPRMFIALTYTPKSGLWLTATPEILLEGQGTHWRTIALAGTMKLEGDQLAGEGETVTWSTKNIQEQRIVATYISECLEQLTAEFHEEGPYTVRAANLVHLRSDFAFSLPDDRHVGDVLQVLHPTPAVCGLPKRETFRFILSNEHTPRRYYSGFMGPLGMDTTHLYVSLRCMSIEDCHYHLYAGGGLLKESILEQEWQETEAKLETMRSLFVHRSPQS